jgi:myo-inositol-1(or 4)-monophosphatase
MNTFNHSSTANAGDAHLLEAVVAAVQSAGQAVKALFNSAARPADLQEIAARIAANDTVSLDMLRARLSALRPQARWAEDEGAGGILPPGEWWVADPVEGAINHIHGEPDWGVTLTLVRDNQAVLTVVHLPMSGDTYTAELGGGAWLNGVSLYATSKTALNAAIVGTGQAVPNEGSIVYRRMGQSVTAMLEAALVVRVAVPATLQLVKLAAGHQDVFWQFSQVRSGLLAGALLVAEAGGSVTDVNGAPWHLGSDSFLASGPALAASAIAVLSPIV